MSSPIYHEWAARQPARTTPAPRPGNPLFAVLALTLLAGALMCAWREFEPLLTYRPIPAVVLSAGIAESEPSHAQNGNPRGLAGFRPRARTAEVNFTYEVDGQRYWAGQVSPAGVSAVPGASRGGGHYTPGTTVTAWFNPWHPSQAVLSREPNSGLLPWIGALTLVAMLMLLVSGTPRDAAADSGDDDESIARSA